MFARLLHASLRHRPPYLSTLYPDHRHRQTFQRYDAHEYYFIPPIVIPPINAYTTTTWLSIQFQSTVYYWRKYNKQQTTQQ